MLGFVDAGRFRPGGLWVVERRDWTAVAAPAAQNWGQDRKKKEKAGAKCKASAAGLWETVPAKRLK